MTQEQFQELKGLIQGNARLIQENAQGIKGNARGISRNFEMIGRIYEEHGDRLGGLDGRMTRVEVGQEQLRDDVRAVAEGVTGNAGRLDRLEGRFDRFETNFGHF
jgi:hypothetical protein